MSLSEKSSGVVCGYAQLSVDMQRCPRALALSGTACCSKTGKDRCIWSDLSLYVRFGRDGFLPETHASDASDFES
ncbi:MAG: hypothetical protein FJY09_03005 [Chlorobi bacterium]|nr:hypothetical protein [Chlorobiota bacterium]